MALTKLLNSMLVQPAISVLAQTWTTAEQRQARANVGLTDASFSATKGGTDQTGVLSVTSTKVTFGTEEWDDGGFYTNSIWTPPAGKAIITCSIRSSTNVVDTSLYQLLLYKNGVNHKAFGTTRASGTGTVHITGTVCVDCNGTDTFEVYFYAEGAGDKTVSGSTSVSFFQGYVLPKRP